MSQRASGYARKSDEAYPSPPWIAEVIAPYLRQRACHFLWEPAAGHMGLTNAFVDLGFSPIPTVEDFFEFTEPPLPRIDCIVTNPPYGIDKRGRLASDFIRHALSFRTVPMVAMLLPIDFDSAKSRTDLFRDHPMFHVKLVLLDRIKWFDGPSSPSVNHAWFIWDRAHSGAPTIRYAARPRSNPEWAKMWAKPLPLTESERKEVGR